MSHLDEISFVEMPNGRWSLVLGVGEITDSGERKRVLVRVDFNHKVKIEEITKALPKMFQKAARGLAAGARRYGNPD